MNSQFIKYNEYIFIEFILIFNLKIIDIYSFLKMHMISLVFYYK